MLLFACDPGERSIGYCLVRSEGRRARYVTSGMADATYEGFLVLHGFLVREVGAPIDVAVMETPDGYVHQPFRSPGLLRTARVAGIGVAIFKAKACHVQEMTAEQWRKPLTGNAKAGDKLIEQVVKGNLLGMPAQSNEHARDAMGMAIFAVWCAAAGTWPKQQTWNKTAKAKRAKGKAV